MSVDVVHVAGPVTRVNRRVSASVHYRQRCAWCGVLLVDETRTAGTNGVHGSPGWAPGAYVSVGFGAAYEVPAGPAPENCCVLLDPDLTT